MAITIVPFRVCIAPGTFERLMEQVLAGIQMTAALVYLGYKTLILLTNFQSTFGVPIAESSYTQAVTK